jgi:23S rRNA (pseudouridine1915-N3)-methyltransferase
VKVLVVVVGKASRLLADAIAEYESRAARYWPLEVAEIRAAKAAKGVPDDEVRADEGRRLLARVPNGFRVDALTRTGDPQTSERIARTLNGLAVDAAPGIAYLIGGALGLSDEVLRTADRRVRLSTLTMTHELARLILAEQLYRAGTIQRGEPYHKART